MKKRRRPKSLTPSRGRPPAEVVLTKNQRAEFSRIVAAPTTSQRDVLRARIILAASAGQSSHEIAEELNTSVDTVSLWRGRFSREGVKGLKDHPHSGAPLRLTSVQRCQILAVACEPAPTDDGRNGWTLDRLQETLKKRGIAEISRSHLHTILQEADLRPHKKRMWLHSPDPNFREKVTEIVELYLHPPPRSTVICVDEKTGMQDGTQALIGGFVVRTGEMMTQCGATRTGDDLEAFMEGLAQKLPGTVHVIWDNLNIHLGERWEEFNKRHQSRFHFHYTPLHASWVNQIELWFGILQRQCLKHGNFQSVEALAGALTAFVIYWNRQKKHPFQWSFTGYGERKSAGKKTRIKR